MTFELTRIWIHIPIQVIKHLEIDLNLENGTLSYPHFVNSVQSVLLQPATPKALESASNDLLHLIPLNIPRTSSCTYIVAAEKIIF